MLVRKGVFRFHGNCDLVNIFGLCGKNKKAIELLLLINDSVKGI